MLLFPITLAYVIVVQRAMDVRVVIYTDGISEAMNPGLEEWGEERLIAAARESTGRCSAEVVAQIMEAAAAHAAGAPQSDDMTLVVLRAVKD